MLTRDRTVANIAALDDGPAALHNAMTYTKQRIEQREQIRMSVKSHIKVMILVLMQLVHKLNIPLASLL
ncbi:MAG: hypothetical protein EZS28_009875 [Streblomastix strix]|uniref:Uncharacterized protein n=1 Tax=Streblomastix strix TaxID=222440 RepID=A0A5J4WJB0_9EUKA|nr:MAG: hypothetical protein EZS28_009875 [Streblomastix strix]